MFKCAQIYRLPRPWPVDPDELERMLKPQTFTACTSMDLQSMGWAPFEEQGIVYRVNRQLFLRLRTEKKLLPSSVIKEATAERCRELEEEQGYTPGRKQRLEVRERVTDELLPRAFSVNSSTGVWIDPVNGWMVVDAASPARADDVVKLLLKAIDKMPLESFRVQRAPVAVMTEWLEQDEAPPGFTIDMDATLRATGESRAVVQYKRHTLEQDDLSRHIAAGKQCVRLALTWQDKISFVLTEGLALTGIKALDVLDQNPDGLDADGEMMLMAGELNRLFLDLTDALGGEAAA